MTRATDLDARTRAILDGALDRRHHEGFGVPADGRYRRHAYPDPDHTPRPLDPHELADPALWLRAVVTVVLGIVVLGLSVVAVGPVR